MLSAYELKRKETIANNNAFLASLGLGDGKTLCKEPTEKKTKRRAPSAPMPENESPRRSSRVAGKVVDYCVGLTDDYFRLEERNLHRERSKRKVNPVVYYANVVNERCVKRREVLRQYPAHQTTHAHAAWIPSFDDTPVPSSNRIQLPSPSVMPGIPNTTQPTHGHKSKYQCRVCGSRTVHHYCHHSSSHMA